MWQYNTVFLSVKHHNHDSNALGLHVYLRIVLWDGLGAGFSLTLLVSFLEAVDMTCISTHYTVFKMNMTCTHTCTMSIALPSHTSPFSSRPSGREQNSQTVATLNCCG